MAIEELNKPRHTWCHHCDKGKGCRIYDTPAKPASCTAYTCLWLYSQSFEDASLRLPERFRPDRTKVVVDTFEHPNYRAAIFWIDPSNPDAINSEVNQSLIKMLRDQYVIIEAHGNKRKVLAINESAAKRMVELGHTPMVGEEWEI
jgi:hypothetical protein